MGAGSCELTWMNVLLVNGFRGPKTGVGGFNKTRDLFYLQIPPRLTSVLAPALDGLNTLLQSFVLCASSLRCANGARRSAVEATSRRYGERRRIKPERHVPGFTERAAAVPGAAAQPRAAAEPRRAAEPLRRQPAAAKEEARPAARARRHGTVQSGQYLLYELGPASFSTCPTSPGLLRRT